VIHRLRLTLTGLLTIPIIIFNSTKRNSKTGKIKVLSQKIVSPDEVVLTFPVNGINPAKASQFR